MTQLLRFPAGDSEASRTISQLDWGKTSLGPMEHWPLALKTHLNLILNCPQSMSVLWGPDLLFFHNDAYAPILGPRREHAMGARVNELWSDVWEHVRSYAEQAMRGVPYECEDMPLSMARYGQMERTWWSFSFSPIFNEHNAVVGLFCLTTETTRRVMDQRALRASEQRRLDLIADLERQVTERARERGLTWQVSPDLLCVITTDLRIKTTNPAWRKALGWSDGQLCGLHLADLIHPDDVAHSRNAFDALSRNQSVLNLENRYRREDGSYCWLSWVAVPEGGKMYCSARDITLEKQQAAALHATEKALIQSQKMEAFGRLTGGLAHDFNNLLMSVSGNIELLRNRIAKGQTEKLERHISAALEGSRRAACLTQRLLAFSRRQTLDPTAIDVNELVQNMRERISRSVGHAITLNVHLTPELSPTRVDARQLENALLSLCINASDAMPAGGELTIQTRLQTLDATQAFESEVPVGQYVTLCVSDTGTGMSSDVAKRAFDPFFTTKAVGMGTGLGLSIVYGFARQSGGGVCLTSVPGEGSQVCIFLPVLDVTTQAPSEK